MGAEMAPKLQFLHRRGSIVRRSPETYRARVFTWCNQGNTWVQTDSRRAELSEGCEMYSGWLMRDLGQRMRCPRFRFHTACASSVRQECVQM
jgi:hypothetical protein